MKTTIIVAVGFLMLILSAGGVKAGDQAYPVGIKAGDVYLVCSSGKVVCPVLIAICDDTSVVTTVDTPDGLGFKGLSPGATLCSVSTSVGPRRLFRITVH